MPLAPRFAVPVSGRFQASAPNVTALPRPEASGAPQLRLTSASLVVPAASATLAVAYPAKTPELASETDRHSDEPGPRAEFRDPTTTTRFMLAGCAYVTFESQKTGTHFTYKVSRNKKSGGTAPTHFVGVLTGPDTYTYLGCLFEGKRWAHGHKSLIGQSAPSAKAFAWCWSKLLGGRMPKTLEVYHEGRCGVCGRRLTTPESVASGLGAICAKKIGGP